VNPVPARQYDLPQPPSDDIRCEIDWEREGGREGREVYDRGRQRKLEDLPPLMEMAFSTQKQDCLDRVFKKPRVLFFRVTRLITFRPSISLQRASSKGIAAAAAAAKNGPFSAAAAAALLLT
jgi:hypothetical protein